MPRLVSTAMSAFGIEIHRRRGRRQSLEERPDYGDLESLLARTEGMITFAEARLLHDLAARVSDGVIVEIGSYRGRSTVALATGSRAGAGAKVYAVEPHEPFVGVFGGRFGPDDRAAFYQAMLETGCYQNVRLVNLPSEVAARGWIEPIGLLWIDGDHSLEGVSRDYASWAPHLSADALVAFDDATDPDGGPFKLLESLRCQDAALEEIERIGKIRVFRNAARTPARSPARIAV